MIDGRGVPSSVQKNTIKLKGMRGRLLRLGGFLAAKRSPNCAANRPSFLWLTQRRADEPLAGRGSPNLRTPNLNLAKSLRLTLTRLLTFFSMRILVTGGAGFLGSHLCDRLIADDHDVTVIDNLFTGRKQNIAHLLQHPRFEFVRHDVIDPFKFEVDQIYNLACPASPPHYQFNPIKTTKTSVMGAINCLGLAKRVRARVFQASTSEVYGDPAVHPQPESYWGNVNPIGKRSCYDEGKRCAETLFFDYHRENGVDIRVVRIFNTYGPRMHEADGRVVSNFIVQALRGQDITIYGDGSQTRSFCYVDDLIEGWLRLMAQTETVGPVNLGNPGEFTMLQLAELTLKLVGGKSKIVHKSLPADDPKQRRPDITLAQKVLGGWTPKVPLEEGLARTIAYFKPRV